MRRGPGPRATRQAPQPGAPVLGGGAPTTGNEGRPWAKVLFLASCQLEHEFNLQKFTQPIGVKGVKYLAMGGNLTLGDARAMQYTYF